MGGGDRNAEPCRTEQRQRAAGFGAETLHWVQPGDFRSHRMNDAPAAEQRAKRHGRLAGNHHPEGHVEAFAEMALAEEQHGNDAHGLLRVVAAVSQRIKRGGDELHDAEGAIHGKGRLPHEQPGDSQHQKHMI